MLHYRREKCCRTIDSIFRLGNVQESLYVTRLIPHTNTKRLYISVLRPGLLLFSVVRLLVELEGETNGLEGFFGLILIDGATDAYLACGN